jgi:ATP-binding cassette, subfamily G (WHITE), member 2, SNQ2
MYYVNPSTYWIGGVLAAVLANQPVRCAPGESTLFNPPPGQTCAQYAGNFVKSAGQGYLTNPSATSECGYCQYASGAEYLATLNIRPDEKWRVSFPTLFFSFARLALQGKVTD